MSNSYDGGVLAVYQYLDHFVDAIENIRDRSDFKGFEVFSPTSYHEIEHALGYEKSPVRFFTLAGGLTGLVSGFLMCLLMDMDWPIVVGGKTPGIYSFPTFVIFMFELTILLGGIATILGMLIMGRLPDPKSPVLDNRLTDDHFAIYVPDVDVDSEQAKFLQQFGAKEISRT